LNRPRVDAEFVGFFTSGFCTGVLNLARVKE
jgi:hypothetical protein